MAWAARLLWRLRGRRVAQLGEIRRSFDEAAGDEEHFPSTIDPRIAHVQLVLRYLAPAAGGRVLDLGCGKGRFARVLASTWPGAQLIGLDLSEAMLRFVPEGVAAVSATLTELPLAGECVDGVYATESLEHVSDTAGAVAEMCRVLRPGGRLVIIDKNAAHWGKLKTPPWEKWFYRDELEDLLRKHCTNVSSQYLSYWEDVEPDGLFIAWLAEK